MIKFKENISSGNLSMRLHDIVKNTFGQLENNSALEVAYGESKYGDFISIILNNEDSILVDLCITRSYVDLLVGEAKSPCYEMQDVEREDKIEEFENLIFKLLMANINEVWYTSGDIRYIDLNENKIFVRRRPMFSFLWPKRISKSIVYKPWIRKEIVPR